MDGKKTGPRFCLFNAVFRIQIHRIRIQTFCLNLDPDSGFQRQKIAKKFC